MLASVPPSYSINTSSSRFPADGAGKPLSRTTRRSLQPVNPSTGFEVINVLRIYVCRFYGPDPVIKDLGFME